MKVLLISGTSSYMKGGVPVATFLLMDELLREGNQPALLADAPLQAAPDLPFYRLDYPQNENMSRQIQTALAEFNPDVCHVVSAGVRMVAVLDHVMRDRPWLMTVHSIPPAERKLAWFHGHNRLHYVARDLRFLANKLAWKRMFRSTRAERIICHSRCVEQTAIQYGCDPARLVVIPLGIQLPEQPTSEPHPLHSDGPRIVTVGGIAHTKGVHDFLRAFAMLLPEFPGARYTIMGEVRDRKYLNFLKRLSTDLGLDKNVSLHESASARFKADALAEADLYVQPSHEEGFCLAYAEAAPIVPRMLGTDTGAIAAMAEGFPASRLVKTKTPSALAQAARDLLREPVPADVFVRRRAFMAERFSTQGYARRHLDLYARFATSTEPRP